MRDVIKKEPQPKLVRSWPCYRGGRTRGSLEAKEERMVQSLSCGFYREERAKKGRQI